MKSRKNAAVIALAVLMLFAAVSSGCGSPGRENPVETMAPEDIAEKVCENVDVPTYEVRRLTSSDFEFFAFVPYDESLTAAAADALVNITPHSVVVIHAARGNGASLAQKVAANADPNKWLCVGSEQVNVAYTDHYVLLVMSEKAMADAITENFKAMAKDLDGMEMTLLTVSNPRYEQ